MKVRKQIPARKCAIPNQPANQTINIIYECSDMTVHIRGRSNGNSRMWKGGVIALEHLIPSWNDDLARSLTIRGFQHKLACQTTERSYRLNGRDRESRKTLTL